MTTKADYTEEEWTQLIQAPITVGMLVIMSDLHVTSMAGEMKGMLTLSDVASLVDAKCAEEEASGYKHWLLGVAEATAEAGKEGGFLGIGAVRVSDKEKAAMGHISQTLGLA